MNYTTLGDTGIRVSKLCFGTMTFGNEADEATSARLYAHCREAGINFFDCANVYVGGKSEEILGNLVKDHREQVFITSKVTMGLRDTNIGVTGYGSSRAHIMHHIDGSLARLGTDYLDFYFLHHYDVNTALEDSQRAMDDLVRAGKVRYPALSNFAAWQTAKAIGICERQGWSRPRLLQPMYNLLKRQAESEILPMAQHEKLGVISYSPLAGGVLTGKYGKKNFDVNARLKSNEPYRIRYGEDFYYDVANRLGELAEQHGHHPVSLAVAWVMAHPGITAPIIGARNLQQLEPALAAADVDMTGDLYTELSSLTPTPALATDREEERSS